MIRAIPRERLYPGVQCGATATRPPVSARRACRSTNENASLRRRLHSKALAILRSVAHERRAPGEPATEGFQQQQLPSLHATRTHGFVERERHRTG